MTVSLAFYLGTRAENPDARLFDRLICWWHRSRGRFSHVEIAVSRSASVSVGDWRLCWASSAVDGGVRSAWIDLDAHWVVVDLEGFDVDAARQWFATREGWRYDWPGILGFVLPAIKQKRQWLYCSEACALALQVAAEPGSIAPPDSAISPSALYAWAASQPGARVSSYIQTKA